MFKFDPLAKVRKWLTTSKDVSTEGKWFADAKSIKDLNDFATTVTVGTLKQSSPQIKYCLCGKICYLVIEESSSLAITDGQVIYTLPEGLRPCLTTYLHGSLWGSDIIKLDITTNGKITVYDHTNLAGLRASGVYIIP